MVLGCRVSAIIYQNTRVYGDYQLIIAINASARQLTVQPNATSTENPTIDIVNRTDENLSAMVTLAVQARISNTSRYDVSSAVIAQKQNIVKERENVSCTNEQMDKIDLTMFQSINLGLNKSYDTAGKPIQRDIELGLHL